MSPGPSDSRPNERPSYNDLDAPPALPVFLLAASLLLAQKPAPFEVEEATIAQVHDAMKAGRLTCRALVGQYLKRIEAYDKNGPAINSHRGAESGRRRSRPRNWTAASRNRGLTGPLHCVPMIVKDNFETKGLQTTDGALAFAGYLPDKDAFLVKRVKEAGAIVLAKSNMAEWAFSPYETVNSILPGYTRNPYALDRVTAGSSGGTAAAIAASLGLVGLGSDTGNSIRGPSSHQALVGIRSTMGLTSRAGVMPLSLLADIAGPMARTVEDAARVFQVIVGEDPDDPVTAAARGHLPQDYLAVARPQRTARRRDRRAAPGVRARLPPIPKSCASFRPRSRICGAPARRSSIPPRSRGSTRSGARGAPARAWASSTTSIGIWPRAATGSR